MKPRTDGAIRSSYLPSGDFTPDVAASKGHLNSVTGLAFDQAGTTLAPPRARRGREADVRALAINALGASPDGRWAVVGREDGALPRFDLAAADLRREPGRLRHRRAPGAGRGAGLRARQPPGHLDRPGPVGAGRPAVGGLRRRDARGPQPVGPGVAVAAPSSDLVHALAFGPAGNVLAFAGGDHQEVTLVDLRAAPPAAVDLSASAIRGSSVREVGFAGDGLLAYSRAHRPPGARRPSGGSTSTTGPGRPSMGFRSGTGRSGNTGPGPSGRSTRSAWGPWRGTSPGSTPRSTRTSSAARLVDNSGTRFPEANATSTTLVGEDASASRVLEAPDALKREEVGDGDVVALVIETHVLVDRQASRLVVSDSRGAPPDPATTVPAGAFDEALESLVRRGCKVLVVLDGVHEWKAGGVKSEVVEWARALRNDLKVVTILATTRRPIKDRWIGEDHRPLARAILESIRAVGIEKGDPLISLAEFREALIRRVRDLTGDSGEPAVYIPNGINAGVPILLKK